MKPVQTTLLFISLISPLTNPFPSWGQTQATPEVSKPETSRSLGLYVTLTRLTAVTDSGLQAIPAGALVTVVEDQGGQKFALFRQIKVAIKDMSHLSNDASKIAAVTTEKPSKSSGATLPGAPMKSDTAGAPESSSQENLVVDDNGKVISKSKTTTVSDGAGNVTIIKQGSNGATAAKLASARAIIQQQRDAIQEFKAKRLQKAVISNYDSKLKQMNDQLQRMEVEYARMEAQMHQ